MTRVKICGITNTEDALAAVECGANALGFVFADSPRRISPAAAAEIIRALPPFIAAVAVVVDEAIDALRKKLRTSGCHAVQLHGEESPGYLEALGDLAVIKAFRVGTRDDLERLADYERADAFLLDSRVKGRTGGTGKAFDWRLAAVAREAGKPVILAGGLNSGNVQTALEAARPYAVDASSGVESEPGRKNHDLMREFVRAVREFDADQG
jgi:phosphoribosylanthranilate isomerase